MTTEAKVRNFLVKPWLWMGIAYFGLVITLVAYAGVRREFVKEQTIRIATEKAANIDKVNTCFKTHTQLPVTLRFFGLLETIAENQRDGLTNNLNTHPGDPRAVGPTGWVMTLKRTNTVLNDLRSLERRTLDTTPTKEECKALAERLHVSITKSNKVDNG